MRNGAAVALGVLVIVGACLLYSLEIRDSPGGADRAQHDIDKHGLANTAGDAAPEAQRTEAPPSSQNGTATEAGVLRPAAQPRSPRAILQEFWGERWSEVETEYLQVWCVMLGEPNCLDSYDSVVCDPWDNVIPEVSTLLASPDQDEQRLAHVRNFVNWPDAGQLTPSTLRSALRLPDSVALDETDVWNIDALVRQDISSLELLAIETRELTNAAVQQMWERGNFERAPFFLPGSSAADALHVRNVSSNGWAIRITLRRSDWASIRAAVEQADAIRDSQATKIREYLSSR